MKTITFALIALVIASTSAYAKSAAETTQDYFNALKQKDYGSAATYFDPAALNDFRRMMGFMFELPAEQQQKIFPAFFGQQATAESVAKLSDTAFFAAFLGAVMAQAESAGGVNFDGMQVIGEVAEGPDLMHVVTRNQVTAGEMKVETMEVVSFRKDGKQWKALLSGKIKGMANQLRAAFSRLPKKPPEH